MWKNIVGEISPAVRKNYTLTLPYSQKLTSWSELSIDIVHSTILNKARSQVGTHADSLIAEAIAKGVKGFDVEKAYEAAKKDATVPPVNDKNTSYVRVCWFSGIHRSLISLLQVL